MSKMKKASMDSITRKVMATTFTEVVAKKIRDSSEFTSDEKDAAKWAVSQIRSAASSWTTSGQKRTDNPSRDALYLREYRTRMAVESATKKGAAPALLRKLKADHREALEAYEKWKVEQGLDPKLKMRPARS